MFHGRKGIFKCGASATAAKFCNCVFRLELMHLSLILNIKLRFIHLHRLLDASAAIGPRNHFFHLYQLNKYSVSKVKLRQAINCYDRVLEAAKLAYTN